jgi:hypothetical protein
VNRRPQRTDNVSSRLPGKQYAVPQKLQSAVRLSRQFCVVSEVWHVKCQSAVKLGAHVTEYGDVRGVITSGVDFLCQRTCFFVQCTSDSP